MSVIKSIALSLKMTPWFIRESWKYITTKRLRSKIEFARGLLPAWFRFTVATYKDIRLTGEGN